jgi:hypothetical protein
MLPSLPSSETWDKEEPAIICRRLLFVGHNDHGHETMTASKEANLGKIEEVEHRYSHTIKNGATDVSIEEKTSR